MKQEVYRSSTLGEIPLSFTGRRLLANLREAISEAIGAANCVGKAGRISLAKDVWEPLSLTRGKIAEYISKLEQKAERSRAYDSHSEDEPQVRVHHVQSFEEAFKIMADYEAGKMPPESNGAEPVKEAEPVMTEPKAQKHEAPNGSTLILPPIPENYVLRMVGGMLVIEPLSIAELQEKSGFVPNKRNGDPDNEKFYSLLNEYRDALINQCEQYTVSNGVGNIQNQGRVDKARMAVIQAYEKPL